MRFWNELVPGADFRNNKRLVDDKVLTSLNLLKLVAKLNEAYDIKITAMHLMPENFNSGRSDLCADRKLS